MHSLRRYEAVDRIVSEVETCTKNAVQYLEPYYQPVLDEVLAQILPMSQAITAKLSATVHSLTSS